MESKSQKLTIITPNGLFLEEMVTEVYAPGSLGITGVLKNHISLVAKLDWGELRYKTLNNSQKFLLIQLIHPLITHLFYLHLSYHSPNIIS